MKTVIVYYSLGGFTKKIAQQLAAKTGADLLRLTPVKEYPNEGAKKFIVGGRAAVAGSKPKLQPYHFNAEKYDRVVFGS
ncbi:MAG: flavodoxin, partial [Ruminococcus sp.]|nr:flavodoxin [Ruminococcus sp.]